MSEAVIVLDKENNITLFNKSAEELFKVNSDDVLNSKINSIAEGSLGFLENNGSVDIVPSFEKEINFW